MNCVYVMIVVAYSFEVIIRDNYPLSKCDKTGYEVELLLQAFSIYSLNEGSEYSITCELSDDTTNSRLTSENVIAIGGISISSSMMRDGIRFSYPTYGSGLNILVNKQESASVWKIFKVFTVELWIVIIFSPLMLGVTSWIYSIIITGDLKGEITNIQLLQELIWNSYSSWMFSSQQHHPGVGKYLSLSIGMLMILIFYGYMASYSTSTSEEHKKFLISYADAVGELVLVAPEYEELAGQYSLYYYTFEGDFYENFDKALELLKDEKIVGILADHAFLSYQADKNTDFTLVSTPFLMYRFSAAVGLGVSDFDYKIINQAISSITDLNTRAELTDEYNLFVKDSKRVQKPINPEMAQGLFFILILISIIAILLSLINHPYFRSASWGNVCIKKTYLAESDYESATQRSEIGIEMKHSRSISEVALTLDHTTDFTDRDAALPMISDMREESLKLIRNATLALIMYEHNFINNVDKLIAYVVGESKKKVNVIEQMESLIQRIGKLSEE